eukprot:IDg3438t1
MQGSICARKFLVRQSAELSAVKIFVALTGVAVVFCSLISVSRVRRTLICRAAWYIAMYSASQVHQANLFCRLDCQETVSKDAKGCFPVFYCGLVRVTSENSCDVGDVYSCAIR